MEFYQKTLALVKDGAPLGQIASLKCREKIVRIKSEVENDKLSDLRNVESLMEAEIGDLERTYRKVELQ